jgi:hypothetical protein
MDGLGRLDQVRVRVFSGARRHGDLLALVQATLWGSRKRNPLVLGLLTLLIGQHDQIRVLHGQVGLQLEKRRENLSFLAVLNHLIGLTRDDESHEAIGHG